MQLESAIVMSIYIRDCKVYKIGLIKTKYDGKFQSSEKLY